MAYVLSLNCFRCGHLNHNVHYTEEIPHFRCVGCGIVNHIELLFHTSSDKKGD